MNGKQFKCKTGQGRYDSKARRILIPEFRQLKLNFLETHIDANPDGLPDYGFSTDSDGYLPNFPILIQGNSEPWTIGNHYLTSKVKYEARYESRTFRGIADHLLDYLRFLEDEGLDYLYFPKNNRLKVTFRYRKRLIDFVTDGVISISTASARINAVVNFYRCIMRWNLINHEPIEGVAYEEITKYINVTSEIGITQNLKINSHNLAILSQKKQSHTEYINDGGDLRPLTFREQSCVLKALLESSREYQLMFYFSLFTGARVQSLGTLRIKHLQGGLDSNGYLRLPIGAGTLIDTKRGKRMTLLVPGWLVKDMLTYSKSSEAKKRRSRSYYGETDDNYLFLSKNGVPYYTSRKEILDRQDKQISKTAGLIDRVKDATIQDGAALRTHIKQILLPRIYLTNPDFQKFTLHDLRATFGMNLLESQLRHMGDQNITAALEYVQQRMGHSNKETTMQYLNYKSRLKWKSSIQHEFEGKLFEHVNTSMAADKLV
ncbi:site-specific integrase [Pseudomonas lurida]|uniref:tyrosine-type recombinase/integrase n=1 Tax=Pseudomonas lurida TaxID=244566 RepID=UPI0015E40F26|nr:site-specific integrase [Pseudomonas lurida]MBA1293749.1 site-specific integrase [Pseudomonas lurida]